MSLALRTALFALVSVSLSHAQTVLFEENFENGLGAWSTTSLWHLEAETDVCGSTITPFPSGDLAARFGAVNSSNVCNFFGTPAGDLSLLAPISIPSGATAVRLKYSTYEATECGPGFNGTPGGNCGWDHRTVSISIDGGSQWTEIEWGGLEKQWLPKSVDLTSYAGEDILLKFRFDAIDNLWNDFLGWVVDDISIEYDAPVATAYCTAKVNSLGCTPILSHSGIASVSGDLPFTVTATQILSNKASKLIWSRQPNAQPFQGGTLCVSVPAARTSVTSSGGTIGANDCSGVYTWAFSPSYLASKSFFAGETLHVQFSGRDPGFAAPNNHSLSAALAVTFAP